MTRSPEPSLVTDLTLGLGLVLKAVGIYFLVGILYGWGTSPVDDWTLLRRFLSVAVMVGLGSLLFRWAWDKQVSSSRRWPWS